MSQKQSNVIHQISPDVATEVSFYRLLKNKRVDIGQLISHMSSPLKSLVQDRHVLVLGDSIEISLHHQVKHIRDAERVGVLSDNRTRGYHLHLSLCLDAQSGHGLGISDQILWNRFCSKQSKAQKRYRNKKRPLDQKETYKWKLGIEHSLRVLAKARQKTFVFDAGADIEEIWHTIHELGVDAVVRLHYDRTVVPITEQAESSESLPSVLSLYKLLDTEEFAGSYSLNLRTLKRHNYSKNRSQNRKGRVAQMNVRFTKVKLPAHPDSKPYYLIEVIESPKTVPPGEDPVHWVLMTTHPVDSFDQAKQIVLWYSLRWMIEQLFRLTKKQGFDVEASGLEYLDSILKQTTITMEAAFRVMQLLLARGKEDGQPIVEVLTQDQIRCLELLNQQMEGKVDKQKNPYPKDQLSWATWIIGRLGGWKGYNQYRPPGPITLNRGWKEFCTLYRGWKLLSG